MGKHYELEIGQRFNKLTVLNKNEYYYSPSGEKREIKYQCECDCGNINYYRASNIIRNISKQCPNCSARDKQIYHQKIGDKFGELVIISEENFKKATEKFRRYCLCRCVCGDESLYSTSKLLTGKSKECKHCAYRKRPQSIKKLSQIERLYKLSIGAEKRNLKNSLSLEEFESLVSKDCYYCDSKPYKRIIHNEIMYANGVDRLDSTLPYFLENCVPCCKICNFAKGTLSLNEFKDHIKKIYKKLWQQEDIQKEN